MNLTRSRTGTVRNLSVTATSSSGLLFRQFLVGSPSIRLARERSSFTQWMNLLEPSERKVMKLRFVEQLQYHEIAAAQAIPIGTVQSRVFNAKKTLAPHLAMIQTASLAGGMYPEGAPAQSSSGWPAS